MSEAKNLVAPNTDALAPTASQQTIMGLLYASVQGGVPVEALREIVALEREISARDARKSFFAALAQFQARCPSIPRESVAKIAGRTTSYSYRYAELDTIAKVVGPLLRELGFAYRWDSREDDSRLVVVCTLSHADGHAESATFSLPIDNSSGMSPQQKHGAALTYGRRQSLVQALGLTMTDDDHDATAGAHHEPITEDQVVAIEDALTAANVDRGRFLAWLGVKSLADLPADRYQQAMDALARKGAK